MNQNRKTLSRPYPEFFMNYLINVFCIHAGVRRFRPLITNFYVTKKCNLRCRYCYPPGSEPESDLSEALNLLEKIRPHNPAINFTGGEPLLYPGIHALLKKAKILKFCPVILSTNGLLTDALIDAIPYVNHLVISLDSPEPKISDSILGVKGATRRIIRNIEMCARIREKVPFHLSLHAVIAPETIRGIEQIVNWCETLNATLSVSPEHGRYYPNAALYASDDYIHLIDRLIALKKARKPVACSYNYLRVIREFSQHRCFPFVSPRVEPDGRVYFPCQRIKKNHVSLHDYSSLCRLMQKESPRTAGSHCRSRCFLACYIEVEQYLRRPLSVLKEVSIKEWIFGRQSSN